jgi:hypothetical protein
LNALRSRRSRLLLLALAIAIAGAVANRHAVELRQRSSEVAARDPSVVLVVLDTLRRDHVSPCGAAPELTPNLAALASSGLTLCNLVVPGSWTLPVHASLFTGLPVAEHGADFSFDGEQVGGVFDPTFLVRPLEDRFRTLAEEARDGGLHTVLVSGNPILAPALGLAQGFEELYVEERFRSARFGYLWRRVGELAAADDSARGQFVVVNISLAHDPFEFPKGSSNPLTGEPLGGFLRLYDEKDPVGGVAVRALLDPTGEVARQVAPSLRIAYGWGVRQADRDLGLVLGALRGAGVVDERSTVIVTTDHGEFLGEEGRFDHRRSVAPVLVDGFAVVVAPGVAAGQRSDALIQSQDLAALARLATRGAADSAVRWRHEMESREPRAWSVSLPDPHIFARTAGAFGGRFDVGVTDGAASARWSAGFSQDGAPATTGNSDLRDALEDEARHLLARLRAWTSVRPDAIDEELRASLQAAGYLAP